MILFSCTLTGRVKQKKNSMRIRRHGYFKSSIAPSDVYELWATDAALEISSAWRRRPPIRKPVNAKMVFYLKNHQHEADLSNMYQGIEDLLQECGVLVNDKLIYSHDGSRKVFGQALERVEIELTPFKV